MSFDAFDPPEYGHPSRKRPAFIKEYHYADSAFFSGVGADVSVGVSGTYDALSGIEGKSYVVFGWHGTLDPQHTQKSHFIFFLDDENGARRGTVHLETSTDGTMALPQPIKFPVGSPVIYETVAVPHQTDDIFYHELFYTIV